MNLRNAHSLHKDKKFWQGKYVVLLFGKDCLGRSECPLKPSEIENKWHMMKNQNSFLYFAQNKKLQNR